MLTLPVDLELDDLVPDAGRLPARGRVLRATAVIELKLSNPVTDLAGARLQIDLAHRSVTRV